LGYVRLILCGRKGLLDFALKRASVLGGRVKPLLPGPLESQAAAELIRRPFDDLGLKVVDERVANRIVSMSGRLPHLIQYYCHNLVELMIERGVEVVS